MWCVCFVLVLLAGFLSADHHVLCPVSSTLDLNQNGSYFFYPTDLFGPLELLESEKSKSYRCITIDQTFPIKHYCPMNASFCPITRPNVQESLFRSVSALGRSSICILEQKLLNPSETVNFYVSGGSVSIGTSADACCSGPECVFDGLSHIGCSWSYHLYQWMKKTYPATINYVNIADHGKNSEFMADELKKRMDKFNIPLFTTNDLLFLDHSVNDNEAGAASAIANGLENLIRHVYLFSEPRSLPTIVLLDADPKVHGKHTGMNYSDVYERVARHYDIPVWSYRDAVLSNYSRNEQSQYSEFLRFMKNPGPAPYGGTHPPWTVHLFMADLYADIWLHDTKKYCNSDSIENRKLFNENALLRNRTYNQLPTPLSVNTSVEECGTTVLDFSYYAIEHKLHTVGRYEFDPPVGGWALRVDKPGRPGGFIVDNSTVEEHAKIVFSLNITTEEFVGGKKELQVIMQYLRSYDNGGIVQVKFCGQKLNGPFGKSAGFLDALWTDFQTNRVSLPDKWSPHSSSFSYTMCQHFDRLNPEIEVIYQIQTFNPTNRGGQKFKLMSVTACLA